MSGDNVYVGFIDDEISVADDTDPFCTKVGGTPAWLVKRDCSNDDNSNSNNNNSKNNNTTPKCGICGAVMVLIIQAYSPLDILPTHERVLYIFCCTESGCSSQSRGWCVLRVHALATEFSNTESSSNIDNWNVDNSSWGGGSVWGSDDWDTTESEKIPDEEDHDATKTPEEPTLDDLELLLKLRDINLLSSTSKNKNMIKTIANNNTRLPTQAQGFFAPHYLVVTEEAITSQNTTTACSVNETDWDSDWIGEEYEYTPDRTMSKFFKRLALNPTQCVRYDFNGTPLLMHPDSSLSCIPPCATCGSPRVFELQIMSTIIYLLNSRSKKCSLDFGVVAIFVCANSCTSVNFQQEYVFVQSETTK